MAIDLKSVLETMKKTYSFKIKLAADVKEEDFKNVDTIYFIEKGEIKGQGSFNELFENNKDFQNMFMIENI